MSGTGLGRAAVLGVVLALTGCGYDCGDFCDDAKDCPNSDLSGDCDCDQIEELNDASGCDDEWDDLMDCAGDLDDICDDGEKCSDEASQWAACAVTWCTNHPNASECD